MKEVKDPYKDNFKTLKKEIKGDTRSCKDFPWSQIGRINVVAMVTFPTWWADSLWFSSEFQWHFPRTLKDSKNHVGSTIIPGVQRKNCLKQYCRARIIKAHGLDSRIDANTSERNRGPGVKSMQRHLISHKCVKIIFLEKNSLLNKCFSENRVSINGRKKANTCLSAWCKSRRISGLN